MPKAARSSEKPPVICAAPGVLRKVTGKTTGRVTPFMVMFARAVNDDPPAGSSPVSRTITCGYRPLSRNPPPTAVAVSRASSILREAASTSMAT